MLFGFGASLDSEPYLIGDMLVRNKRMEGNGGGFKAANASKGGEGTGKEEKEEEEQEDKDWKSMDDGRPAAYNKNKWFLVAEWHDVDMNEALRRAAEIMTEDFNNAGGPLLEYGAPTEKKIEPYGAKNASEGFSYFYFYI